MLTSTRLDSVWSQSDSTQFLSVETRSLRCLCTKKTRRVQCGAYIRHLSIYLSPRSPWSHGKTAHSRAHSPRFHIVVQRHDPTNDRRPDETSKILKYVRVGCSPPSSRASAPREARAHSLAVPPAGVARLHHVSPSGRGASRSHRKACRSRRQGGSSDGSDG